MSAKGSELKRVRQSRKSNAYNNHYKSQMKTAVKNILSSSDKKEVESLLPKAIKTIDKVASKGVIHKGKAANQKSKITKYVNTL